MQRPETQAANSPAPIVFTTTYADLSAGLQAAALAIATKPLAPVLGGVLMDSIGGRLMLTAFDYEVHARAFVPTATCTEGRLLVDHRSLLKALAGLVDGLPTKKKDVLRVEIRAATPNTPTVTVDGYTVPLKALPIEDYPAPQPALPPVVAQIRRAAWLTELERVLSAVGKDDTLPFATGVLVELENRAMRMTCTDRFRLTTVEVPVLRLQEREISTTALVPGATLSKLMAQFKKLTDEWVQVGLDPANQVMSFTSGGVTLSTLLLDSKFPDYQKLLPKEQAGHATVNRKALTQQVKRAASVEKNLDDTMGSLAMRIQPGGVSVRVRLAERDDQVKVPLLPATVSGCDRELWFAPKYLLECLASFSGDTVTVFPSTRTYGATLVCDQPTDFEVASAYRHLIMPVRQPDLPAETT
jgi:DNA polymerase-3 subunit beta